MRTGTINDHAFPGIVSLPQRAEDSSMNASRRALLIATLGFAGAELGGSRPAAAASASEINQEAHQALQQLYATHPRARELGSKAIAILVFPRIYKGGLVIGGESGDGVMWIKGRPAGYYNLSAASFGLQAGGQRFSYALFFMTEGSVKYLQSSNGWSIGSGPSVVVV